MADQKNTQQHDQNDQSKAMGASAVATPNMTDAQQLKSQRGGPQEDQLAGETERGAHNQANENRNPTGQHPDKNQNARQEGNEL